MKGISAQAQDSCKVLWKNISDSYKVNVKKESQVAKERLKAFIVIQAILNLDYLMAKEPIIIVMACTIREVFKMA